MSGGLGIQFVEPRLPTSPTVRGLTIGGQPLPPRVHPLSWLESRRQALAERRVVLRYGELRFESTLAELGVSLDVDDPKTLGMGAFGRQFALWRREQQEAMERAKGVMGEVEEEFARLFGRHYGGLLETYSCDGVEAMLVTMGAITGTAREVVDDMRAEGKPVGLLKLRSYRPFPREELRRALGKTRAVAVVDRDLSFGYEGALASDIKAALHGLPQTPGVLNFIAGLGGSDVRMEDIKYMLEKALETPRGEQPSLEFVGL